MAVTLASGSIKRFRGLSTDEKPGRGVDDTTIPVDSIFTEIDTGARYVWGGSWPWVRQEQTIESLLSDLRDTNEAVLAELQVLRAATATIANGQWGTDYPTG